MNQINKTTFAVIGGAKVIAMTGAKVMVDDSQNIITLADVKKSPKKVTHAKIAYVAGRDTYTVTCYNIRGFQMKKLSEVEDVQVGSLVQYLESVTGLAFTL